MAGFIPSITITGERIALAALDADPSIGVVVSICDPGPNARASYGEALRRSAASVTYLDIHDIAVVTDGLVAFSRADGADLLRAAREAHDRSCNILVHCALGVSRSPAAAIVMRTELLNLVAEADIEVAQQQALIALEGVLDYAMPNTRIASYARSIAVSDHARLYANTAIRRIREKTIERRKAPEPDPFSIFQ